ncbi:MAG: CBS domain-containing protein [Thermodesulfobacteriota bacterium]|nr:CBS domain-containing protein [Thermodesulfobacteriota bacterium]
MVDMKLLEKLGRLEVADIMVTDVITVESGERLENVLKIFRDKGFKGVPVIRKNCLLGVAYAVDLLKAYFMSKSAILDISEAFTLVSLMNTKGTVDRFMCPRPATVYPSDDIATISKKMVKTETYTFPVVEKGSVEPCDNGIFLGMVTLSDVIPLIYH